MNLPILRIIIRLLGCCDSATCIDIQRSLFAVSPVDFFRVLIKSALQLDIKFCVPGVFQMTPIGIIFIKINFKLSILKDYRIVRNRIRNTSIRNVNHKRIKCMLNSGKAFW